MNDQAVMPSPQEFDRLRHIEDAATTYIAAQEEVWRHRRALIENDKAFCYWMAQRDELADAVETALVALTTAVHRGP
ncbi:MAG: hypothetical protein WBC44_14570 [Planctomycetaceae bacterium]